MIRLLLPANLRGEVLPVGSEVSLNADRERMYVEAGSAEYVVESDEDNSVEAESKETAESANYEAQGTAYDPDARGYELQGRKGPDDAAVVESPEVLVEESVDQETGEITETPTKPFGRTGKPGRPKKSE